MLTKKIKLINNYIFIIKHNNNIDGPTWVYLATIKILLLKKEFNISQILYWMHINLKLLNKKEKELDKDRNYSI